MRSQSASTETTMRSVYVLYVKNLSSSTFSFFPLNNFETLFVVLQITRSL